MSGRTLKLLLVAAALVAFPRPSPAPLIYKAGEGWTYEPVGGESGKWQANRAKDQLDIAKAAFDKKDYDTAASAAKRVVSKWPLSDYAPEAQYYVARCHEEERNDERAFKAYQMLIEKYPKAGNYDEVLKRQYEIATRYLNGQRFKLFGLLPLYRSMEKTVKMYEKVIQNGPYSEMAPKAQMQIGQANEKQDEFTAAIKAYETAADRYHDQKNVSAEATYKAAETYYTQARTAEYDQGLSGKAIATYSDFIALFPNDARVAEARTKIENLRTEQARGAMGVAEFYEKQRKWSGALVYYNEVLVKAPNSLYAAKAKEKIEELKQHVEPAKAEK